MKIDEYKDKYLNQVVGRGRAESTKSEYERDLDKFFVFLRTQGIETIEAVTTQVIEDYIFEKSDAPRTKRRKQSSIKGYFDFLTRRRDITLNPADNLQSIKVPDDVPEFLSKGQYELLLETIERKATPYYKERDLLIAKLLIRTGLRRAELYSLNVADVDLSKLRLRVKRKGNREELIILPPQLAKELKRYIHSINRTGNEPLFLSKKGQRLSTSSIWHLIKTYAHEAGLNDAVTVHSLRHTFATRLLSKNLPLPYIQSLMGHKSPQTTSRYLHIQNNELIDAFSRVTAEEGW